jgi:hypothetical protein
MLMLTHVCQGVTFTLTTEVIDHLNTATVCPACRPWVYWVLFHIRKELF